MSTSIYIQNNLGAQYSFQDGLTGTSTVYIPPGQTGTWLGVAERFGYQRQSVSFEPALGGDIPFSPVWVQDVYLTVTNPDTVAGYTTLADLSKVYDFNAYWRTTNAGIPYDLVVKNGAVLDFGTASVIVDALAASVFAYNSATNTFTIKAAELNSTALFSTIKAASITTANGAVLKCLYQTSTGLSARVFFSGLINSTLAITDGAAAQYMFGAGKTGSYVEYLTPGQTGTWAWIHERYGYKRQVGTFTPASGGDFFITPTMTVDGSLTESNVALVAAYTDLGTASKVNDYEAYWRTTSAGVQYDDTLSRNADTLNWTPYDVEIDPLAATPYAITSNKVTVKTTNLVANTVTTTGVVTKVNGAIITGVVTDSTGVATQTTIVGLTGCSVAIVKDTGVLFDFQSNVTGTYTLSIPSSESGTWKYIITKFKRKYQEGSFVLGSPLPTTVTYLELVDDRVVAANASIPQNYTILSSTQEMYDYFNWWATTAQGIAWYKAVSWQGTVLDVGVANIAFDPTATSIASMAPVTHLVTIKSLVMSGDLTSTGTFTRVNGATTSGLVTDATGTTAIVTFTGFSGTNKLYVEDSIDTQRVFTTVTTSEYVLYLLPAEQTNHPWSWAAKKTGYQHAVGTLDVSNAGRIVVQIGMGQILQPDGTAMFTTTPVPSTLSVDWTTSVDDTPRIKLGDRSYFAQDVYNATDLSLSTLDGMKWLTNGNSDVRIAILPAGNFIFLSAGWRFMESAVGNDNAGVNGFAISTDNQTIDNTNGPVSLLSTSSAISDADLAKIRETWDRLVNHVEAKVDTSLVDLTDIKGTGFTKDRDSLTNQTIIGNTSIALSA